LNILLRGYIAPEVMDGEKYDEDERTNKQNQKEKRKRKMK
jgi:hypothetical protein